MAERSEFDRFFDKLEAADPQFQEIATLRAQVSALQTEAKHWKDQHANEVKRARILKDTTDLPLERVRAYELTGELQGQVEKLKEQLESADAGWIAWQEKHGEELLKREAVELERDQLRAEVERLQKERDTIADIAETTTQTAKETARWLLEAQSRYVAAESERDQLRVEVERLKGTLKGATIHSLSVIIDRERAMMVELEDEMDKLRDDLSTSYKKGAESMRERAAEVAEATKFTVAKDATDKLHNYTCGKVAEAIRALPLKENEG